MHLYLSIPCPTCGQGVIMTSHGYQCSGCGLFIPQYISNRYISPKEAEQILSGENFILDGFSSNNGKIFSAMPVIHNNKVEIVTKVDNCPFNGSGSIIIGTHRFYCNAHKGCPQNCHFMLRRSYNGHRITPEEVQCLNEKGKVSFMAFDDKNELIRQTIVKSKYEYRPMLKTGN